MDTLKGTVERVTFQNEDNGYTVFKLQPESSLLPVTCVGITPTIEQGLSVVLNGAREKHARYGEQFSVQSYEIVRPTTLEGITRLLSSGFITNIGESRARAIVQHFGLDTLNVFDSSPQRLREVPGIGPKTSTRIREAWDSQRHLRALLQFLQPFGVTLNLAYKIYKAYGGEAQAKISAEPYALIDDIWGVGFKRADAIAQKIGYTRESYKRIVAGLRFVLEEASAEGHCYLHAGELAERATAVLEVDSSHVVQSLDHGCEVGLLVREDDHVYLPALHVAEIRVAELLRARFAVASDTGNPDPATVRAWLESRAKASGWQVDPKQLDACLCAVNDPVSILTGGPGTGKTTTLQLLVGWLRTRNVRVSLAAPTGRAAQRMGGVAGIPAQTIHRLLEFRPQGGRPAFGRNSRNPLETDMVVVDEVSMVDIHLMRSLLEALPRGARLLLVGDSDQLPSIGPGNVLADLIRSGRVRHVELTTLFRQAAASRIVTCAHEVRRGEVGRFANAAHENCFFVQENDVEKCAGTVVDLVCSRLPRRYGLNPRLDVQVLTPMHRGPLGTQNLNRALQERLVGSGPRVTRGEVEFAEGDRVMQVRNNYDKGVFNGDIGTVARIGEERELWVEFGGGPIGYGPRELDELTHAYSITIHKSQGCEFRAVVIPLSTQHFVMLRRNLLYTALTRARELCVFVGSQKAFGIAVRTEAGLDRNTGLAARLR